MSRRRLHLLCLSGLLVLSLGARGQPPLPAQAESAAVAPAADRTLTLVAWNIEHLAAADGAGCRPRDAADYKAIRGYLKRLDADLIAFQEVENAGAARRIFPASDYEVHVSARPPGKVAECRDLPQNNRLMQRTGFAVRKDLAERLGLKAIRQPDVEALQGARGFGRWGVHLTLEPVDAGGAASMPALPLHLVSIHLKSGCAHQRLSGKKARSNCSILAEQVEALAEWVNAQARQRQNFIVAGDFNRQLDMLSDEVWRRLEAGDNASGYIDLEKALHGFEHPRPFNPRYRFAVDHVVYNQALDNLMVEEQTCFDTRADGHSDHLPLVAVFDLSPRANHKTAGEQAPRPHACPL